MKITNNGITVYPTRLEVVCEGEPIPLTMANFRFLLIFMYSPDDVIEPDQLYKKMHGMTSTPAAMKNHMSVLVNALRNIFGKEVVITIPKVGYLMPRGDDYELDLSLSEKDFLHEDL